MNKNKDNNFLSTGMKNLSEKPKLLTPSVLGVANSHGVKLSPSMTSEDKKNLLSKLDEWRKARKDKLAARILNKQKQFEKVMIPTSTVVSKSSKPSMQNDGGSKIQDRQSVFERLYKNNNAKIKRPYSYLSNMPNIPKTSWKKSGVVNSEKPVYLSRTGINGTSSNSAVVLKEYGPSSGETFADYSAHNLHNSSANENGETERTINAPETITPPEKKYAETRDGVPLQKSQPTEALKNSTTVKRQLVGFNKVKNPIRRSVSMMFRQRCRNEHIIRRSFSAKNLGELNLTTRQKLNETDLRTMQRPSDNNETRGETELPPKSVSFLTPKHKKATPEGNLRSKLEEWLKKNGHSLEGYRHLRCFGIKKVEKKCNTALSLDCSVHLPEVPYYDASSPASEADDENKENLTPPTAMQIGLQADAEEVGNWLKELHRLVVELKFPPERCEEWLAAIRKKYDGCTQLPIYWECLAALYESKGDLNSAIEHYERAIIKGSEVNAVGDSLSQLFEKMVIEQGKSSKPKLEKGLDPKNIFKSTIIKFALQQKSLKKISSSIEPEIKQQLYVATPVRRSTRIQTPYKSSEEVTSLQTLTPELRKNVIFKPNDSLLNGD